MASRSPATCRGQWPPGRPMLVSPCKGQCPLYLIIVPVDFLHHKRSVPEHGLALGDATVPFPTLAACGISTGDHGPHRLVAWDVLMIGPVSTGEAGSPICLNTAWVRHGSGGTGVGGGDVPLPVPDSGHHGLTTGPLFTRGAADGNLEPAATKPTRGPTNLFAARRGSVEWGTPDPCPP